MYRQHCALSRCNQTSCQQPLDIPLLTQVASQCRALAFGPALGRRKALLVYAFLQPSLKSNQQFPGAEVWTIFAAVLYNPKSLHNQGKHRNLNVASGQLHNNMYGCS